MDAHIHVFPCERVESGDETMVESGGTNQIAKQSFVHNNLPTSAKIVTQNINIR